MKKNIHPQYYPATLAKCSCGASFVFGSTVPEIKTEICSACHPFYTGKQKLVDTAGKVDKFQARVAKKQEKTAKTKVSNARIKAANQALKTKISAANETKKVVKRVKSAGLKRELAKAKVAPEKSAQNSKPAKKASAKTEAKK